jgi:hypothetical protein
MQKRGVVNLPQKRLKTKVIFKEKVPCLLHIALQGKDLATMTQEERDKFMQIFCTHPVWPAFMPSCQTCLKDKEYETTLTDKKGRSYRRIA